ncbi:hypothetical protein EMGBS10_15990 [Opitutia bacterium]|nr:hypothetical protein EMGBS10_15990 [Opitutae bacterium]
MPHPLKALLGALAMACAPLGAATPTVFDRPALPPEACPVPAQRPDVGNPYANPEPLIDGAARMEIAKRNPGWKAVLADADAEVGACAQFLILTMPAADWEKLSADFIATNIREALAARRAHAWAANVPWPLFLNDVLPYACLDEPREAWRADFRRRFGAMVKDAKTRDEAARIVNARIQGETGVKYSTKRRAPNQSPADSMRQGMASCSGLSILLCDAFRAIGLPARVAGVPTWTTINGNHNWVEVWLGPDGAPRPDSPITPPDAADWARAWRVTEYNPDAKGWDHAWFMDRAAAADPARPETRIYATSWHWTGLAFPMVWDLASRQVHGLDRTAAYHGLAGGHRQAIAADRCLISVRATRAGKRVAATVSIVQPGQPDRTVVTRGEDKDLNDIARFEVPAHEGRVELRVGDVTAVAVPAGGKEVVVELALP